MCDSLLSLSVPACPQNGWSGSGIGAGQLGKTAFTVTEASILAAQILLLGGGGRGLAEVV